MPSALGSTVLHSKLKHPCGHIQKRPFAAHFSNTLRRPFCHFFCITLAAFILSLFTSPDMCGTNSPGANQDPSAGPPRASKQAPKTRPRASTTHTAHSSVAAPFSIHYWMARPVRVPVRGMSTATSTVAIRNGAVWGTQPPAQRQPHTPRTMQKVRHPTPAGNQPGDVATKQACRATKARALR